MRIEDLKDNRKYQYSNIMYGLKKPYVYYLGPSDQSWHTFYMFTSKGEETFSLLDFEVENEIIYLNESLQDVNTHEYI